MAFEKLKEKLGISNNAAALFIIFFILLIAWANLNMVMASFITGKATENQGHVRICTNKPPTISYSCSLTANVSKQYSCDIDAVADTGENLTFYDYTDIFDINVSSGMISFIPSSSQEGSHLVNITVRDNSTCTNDFDSTIINLTITRFFCGDGTCGTNEDCSSCASDCGTCTVAAAVEKAAAPSAGGGGGGVTRFGIDFTAVDDKIVTAYEGDKITFTFNGITPHSIWVSQVENLFMVVVVDSGLPMTVNLKQVVDVDMNDDGIEDIKIELMGVDENKKAKIRVIEGKGSSIIAKEDQLPLKIEPESIKVLLKVGGAFEQLLKLKNLGNYDFNVKLDAKSISKFVDISDADFIILGFQTKDIALKFKAMPDQQPGVYTGQIFVEAIPSPGKGEKMSKTIPVLIEIESKEVFFDASVDIPAEYKEVMPGQEVKGIVTIFNLKKTMPVEINVDYIIQDMYGNEIARSKDVLSVEDQVSFDKTLMIPEGTKEGDYLFIVQTRYGESFSTTTEKFSVGSSKERKVEETRQIVEEVQKRYNTALFAGIGVLIVLGIAMFAHYRKRIGRIEVESREKIVRRLEELEQKYKREYERAEGFIKDEEAIGLEKLADFIREHIDKGFSKEQISDHLRKYGWKDHHIEHAMKKVAKKRLEEEIENLRKMAK